MCLTPLSWGQSDWYSDVCGLCSNCLSGRSNLCSSYERYQERRQREKLPFWKCGGGVQGTSTINKYCLRTPVAQSVSPDRSFRRCSQQLRLTCSSLFRFQKKEIKLISLASYYLLNTCNQFRKCQRATINGSIMDCRCIGTFSI